MELFAQLMQVTLALFQTEFTLWGFTFSFFEVFVYTTVAGIVCWILGEIFLGD